MRLLKTILTGAVSLLLLTVGFFAISVQARAADGHFFVASTVSSEFAAREADSGNYCISCHLPEDPRLENPTQWRGDFQRLETSPCPAAASIQEELYYTERMLLAIDRSRSQVPSYVDAGSTDKRIAASLQSYHRLLDAPVSSRDAFASDAQMLRYGLGKSYTQINALIEAAMRQRILIGAGAVSLVILLSLGWGLYNTQGIRSSSKKQSSFSYFAIRAVFLLLIFAVFALPIFRLPAQETTSASAEEQERQAVLDTSTRAGDAAERALARAWMLARVGAAWTPLDPQKSDAALLDALSAAEEAQQHGEALWGEALAAQEASIGSEVALEKAKLVVQQLEATRSRAWGLRMIAAEWMAVDPGRAEEILSMALQAARQAQGVYRDLDLRLIAVTMAAIDPQRAVSLTAEINDPALQSWALREIALSTRDEALFQQAADAAQHVDDPLQRARLLGEIGAASGAARYFEQAEAALNDRQDVSMAYALSDLAALKGDISLADRIDPAYPAARAAAYLRLRAYESAWDAAAQIRDPYERARAQAATAGAWGDIPAAQEIAVPALRHRALRDIAIARGDMELAASISDPYYRLQAFSALGQYEAAWGQADLLNDSYPLMQLALAWAEADPEAAQQVIDELDREVEKAAVLRRIASLTGEADLFDQALGMALAARVRGDVLAPAQASLELAKAFASTDLEKANAAFEQAFDIAHKISIK